MAVEEARVAVEEAEELVLEDSQAEGGDEVRRPGRSWHRRLHYLQQPLRHRPEEVGALAARSPEVLPWLALPLPWPVPVLWLLAVPLLLSEEVRPFLAVQQLLWEEVLLLELVCLPREPRW